MRKIVIALMMLSLFAAHAENENAATSKEYVDTEIATKQPIIPAEGNNVVMTFDNTAADGIGTKNIYDPSGDYASQQDALVTAGAANAAVQMAINGEFYCKEWSTIVENDCWLWGIRETTNLLRTPVVLNNATFDATTAILSNTWTTNKQYVSLYLLETDRSGLSSVTNFNFIIMGNKMYAGQTYKTTFTSDGNTHYLLIKHNDSTDVGAYFAIEPLTTYTIVVKAIETDLSVVGGMKLQLMLVRGNYDGTDILPYGENVFIPQNVQ